MPEISVVMPVHNGEKYIKEAVDSILSQTFHDFEFIIIDDGSTDRTAELLSSYNDERIKIIKQKKSGISNALNSAISVARGRYIARMDADDRALPERFEKQILFMDENPEIGISGCSVNIIDEEGVYDGAIKYPLDDRSIRKNLIKRNCFIHPAVIIRKSVFDGGLFYDNRFYCSQDYDLWFRIADKYRLANLDEPLLEYRVNNQNLTTQDQKKMLKEAIGIRINAIKKGYYSVFSYIYLIAPLGLLVFTPKMRRRIRIFQKRFMFSNSCDDE